MDKTYWKNFSSFIILSILAVLSFLLLRDIFLAIITGIILGFIFLPIYKRIFKVIRNKDISALLICVLFIALIFLPLWFLTPILVDQSIEIFTASQKIDFANIFQQFFPSLFKIEGFSNEVGSVLFSFTTKLTNSIMNMVSSLILNFPTIFLQSMVMFFVFFFVLRDSDKFVLYIQSLLPFGKEVEKKLFKSSKEITYSILYGQIVIGIIQGLIIGLGFFLFGVNNALFLTILVCLAGIFPIIGSGIVWIPVVFFLLIEGQIVPAFGVIFFGLIGGIFENFIKPIFVSKRTNVHSAVILLGMVGGILFLGILGIVLGPLILAYLLIVLEIYRDQRVPSILITEGEENGAKS